MLRVIRSRSQSEPRQLPCQAAAVYPSVEGRLGPGVDPGSHTMGASKEWNDKEENQMRTVKAPFPTGFSGCKQVRHQKQLLGEGFRVYLDPLKGSQSLETEDSSPHVRSRELCAQSQRGVRWSGQTLTSPAYLVLQMC